MAPTKLVERVLRWCVQDDVGLWNVAEIVADHHGIELPVLSRDPEWLQQETASIILGLMTMDVVEAGSPNGTDFQPFPESAHEIERRIRKEWAALEHSVSLGDICWLRATPRGHQVARELGLV